MRTPRRTEKHSPWAWRGPWYGSWPRISTRVSAYGVRCSAANTSSGGGYTVVRSRSAAHERLQLRPVGLGELAAQHRVPVRRHRRGHLGCTASTWVVRPSSTPAPIGTASPSTASSASSAAAARSPPTSCVALAERTPDRRRPWTDSHRHEETNWVLEGELHVDVRRAAPRSSRAGPGGRSAPPRRRWPATQAPVYARMLFVVRPVRRDGHGHGATAATSELAAAGRPRPRWSPPTPRAGRAAADAVVTSDVEVERAADRRGRRRRPGGGPSSSAPGTRQLARTRRIDAERTTLLARRRRRTVGPRQPASARDGAAAAPVGARPTDDGGDEAPGRHRRAVPARDDHRASAPARRGRDPPRYHRRW